MYGGACGVALATATSLPGGAPPGPSPPGSCAAGSRRSWTTCETRWRQMGQSGRLRSAVRAQVQQKPPWPHSSSTASRGPEKQIVQVWALRGVPSGLSNGPGGEGAGASPVADGARAVAAAAHEEVVAEEEGELAGWAAPATMAMAMDDAEGEMEMAVGETARCCSCSLRTRSLRSFARISGGTRSTGAGAGGGDSAVATA